MGLCKPVDGRPKEHVTLEGIQLDVVESFRNHGYKICPGCGCELATINQNRAVWGKFCEMLPLLTSTKIYLARCGKLYGSGRRGTLLHTRDIELLI